MCAHPGPDGSTPGPRAAGRYGEDVFPPDLVGEGDRIDLGALTYDDITMARLRDLGAGPGWNCLDLGAGTGTVSRRLLREEHVDSVLAVDRDVRFLTAHPLPGLDVMEADITAPDFDPGRRFHLVHARFVLMHLPERPRLISSLTRLLLPGGVLVISDAVDPNDDAAADTTPYTRVMRAMWQGLRNTIGTDVSRITDHPHLLRAAGLARVGAEIRVPPLLPGSPISRFWADTWDRARAAIVATGQVDDASVDAAMAYLDSPDCADLSAGMLTAWGRNDPAPD
ncbi:methyltransferase domain-containing protein [Streptomyces sp. NBC_00513]|uniref:class I SAM-dependent methyltransferase n=1 Tax=unclassified Streptomyces TaxID=2593676 RepID=UPI00225A8969|nr:class I SAM-dependent methyltransferase [Streptomyces sp. NBC_00424]MCX5071737.1 methyltransferase domain-containing protein [Streptomyces sp. NBC_00424]WUD44880.1 methyltransferase domain-containing protein [Streptomyces sp. NBC_00513]